MERLQKVIAQAGLASRRKAEDWIRSGRVKVNGQVVTALGVKVNPARDTIEVDGTPLRPEKLVYIMLHKPEGYVTTLRDPQGRPTVIDLLHGIPQRLFPVGRLDYNTRGLLLLTNDGALAHRLAHPSYEVVKVYQARLRGSITDEAIRRLREGVRLVDGMTAPAAVRLLSRKGGTSRIEIGIREGRNRQVRRMLAAVGFPVVELVRVRFGPLELGDLPEGKFRRLQENEVTTLKRMVSIETGARAGR